MLLGTFFLIALLNPVFKKYDYGAGFPMVIVFAVLLGALALSEWKKDRERDWLEQGALLAFVAAMILSFVFSDVKNLGFSELLAWVTVAAFYFMYAYRENEWYEVFLKIVGVAALLSVALGYVMYFSLPEPRMSGPFFNILYHANDWPNAFALFLLMVWPLFLMKKGRKYEVMLGFVLSGLLLTFSRGAMIAFGGQLVLLIAYFWRSINKKTMISVLVTAVVAVGLFGTANIVRSFSHEVIDVEARIAFENNEGLTSKQERVDFWKGAFTLINQKPIFGYGPSSFRQAYNPIQETFMGNSDHPHNLFLKIGAENGLIALGAFFVFLGSFVLTVGRRFKKEMSDCDRKMVVLLGIALAGALAHSMIDYNFNFIVNLMLFFGFLAIIRSKYLGEKKVKKSYVVLILSLVIGIFALYEGSVLVVDRLVDQSVLNNSLFPRNHYLNEADEAMNEGEFEEALVNIAKQKELNQHDDRAIYLGAVILCDESYAGYDLNQCIAGLWDGIAKNPKNEIGYYSDVLRALTKHATNNGIALEKYGSDIFDVIRQMKEMLLNYYQFVENNVHFTAYTHNVEAAAELTDILVPYLDKTEGLEYIDKKDKMLATAKRLRAEKKY